MLILPSEKHSLGIQFPKPCFYNKHCQRVFWTELLLGIKKKNDAFSWKVSLKGSDLGLALRST